MNVLQPTTQAIQPVVQPSVFGDIGRGVGRERHRRRDHRQHAVVHDEHMRGHRRDAELDQRRREQRCREDVDAHRRQADAEHEGKDGDQQQQQEHVFAGQRQKLHRHAEGEAGDAHDPDHDAGGGADQDDVERHAAGLDDRHGDLLQRNALAAIAEHEREHDQDAGGGDRGLLRRQQQHLRIDQRDDEKDDRHQEVPARLEHACERRHLLVDRRRRCRAWPLPDRRG